MNDTKLMTNSFTDSLYENKEHYLLVTKGNNAGRRIKITPGNVTFGRDPEADVRFTDNGISGRHCRISLAANNSELLVEDLNSTNGTMIEQKKITSKSVLPVGADLSMGHNLMRHEFRTMREIIDEEKLYMAATTDELTGVLSRRSFMEKAAHEVAFAHRNNSAISVLMVDADNFKTVNDTWGHPAGDAVLQMLGSIFIQETRSEDIVARFGGEEFIFMLRNQSAEEAMTFAERIRTKVAQASVTSNDVTLNVTISVGLSDNCANKDLKLEELISQADKAVYQAKEKGRNQVVTFAP